VSTLAERLTLLMSLVEDLSLRELGRLIGVSETYPGLIASGDRPKISGDIAADIAALFGTTTDFVLRGTGELPTREVAGAAVAAARAAKKPKTDPPPAPPDVDEAPSESERTPTGESKAAS
jgi:transcriptional regulator with XRE-family HTH domain